MHVETAVAVNDDIVVWRRVSEACASFVFVVFYFFFPELEEGMTDDGESLRATSESQTFRLIR